MTPIPLTPETEAVARRVVWFETPAKALADPVRFMAYVMTEATADDLAVVRRCVTDDDLREALDKAPSGINDPRSWAQGNNVVGRYPAPPVVGRRVHRQTDRMAGKTHHYRVALNWTGADDGGNRRDYVLTALGKPPIAGSADAVFGGDAARWNPEDLLVASLSACHQLWYLGLCAAAGIAVTGYTDAAEGVMIEESAGGAGQFTEVVLRPVVTLAAPADTAKAMALHDVAHARCFIARSVTFPVRCEPRVTAG